MRAKTHEEIDGWYARLMGRAENDKYFWSSKKRKRLWDRIHATDWGYLARVRYLHRQGILG